MTNKASIIIGTILFGLLGFLMYQDAQINTKRSTEKSYSKQYGIHTTGYENGKKVYEVELNEVYQKSYRHIMFVDELLNGNIYNKNETAVVRNISGKKGRINSHLKSILVTGNITAIIEPTTSTKSIDVTANGFRYIHKQKKSSFFDQITLIIDDKTLTAPLFNYYSNNETAIFPESLTIQSNHSNTISDRAIIKINDSQIIATNNIKTVYQKAATASDSKQLQDLLKSKTTITAQEMNLDFSDNDFSIIEYKTDVTVSQSDKSLTSDQIYLNFKDDIFESNKNITIIFNSLQWSINKNKTIMNTAIKDMLTKKTTIQSDYASFDPNNNIITFKHSVIAKQTNFKLICDAMTYDIKNETILLTGNVKIYKFGIEYLNTNKLTIDIKNETFTTGSKNNLSEIMIEI